MSASDDDFGWIVWVAILGGAWYFWGNKPVEEREDYQSGYSSGYEDGHYEGRREGMQSICDEVESRLNYGAASAVGC